MAEKKLSNHHLFLAEQLSVSLLVLGKMEARQMSHHFGLFPVKSSSRQSSFHSVETLIHLATQLYTNKQQDSKRWTLTE